MKLGHLGIVVDLFLLALAEEVRGVLDQFLFPIADLAGVDFVLTGKLCQGLLLRQGGQGNLGLKFCAITGAMLHGTSPFKMDRFIAYTPVSKSATTSLPPDSES